MLIFQYSHPYKTNIKELKIINTRISNKRGIRNKSIKMFPKKLMRNLNPKKGIIISVINE